MQLLVSIAWLLSRVVLCVCLQLFVGLRRDVYREQCFDVLATLLLGYRYSPHLFHSVCDTLIPRLSSDIRHPVIITHSLTVWVHTMNTWSATVGALAQWQLHCTH